MAVSVRTSCGGESGDDRIFGESNDDEIFGDAGNDTVFGGGGMTL